MKSSSFKTITIFFLCLLSELLFASGSSPRDHRTGSPSEYGFLDDHVWIKNGDDIVEPLQPRQFFKVYFILAAIFLVIVTASITVGLMYACCPSLRRSNMSGQVITLAPHPSSVQPVPSAPDMFAADRGAVQQGTAPIPPLSYDTALRQLTLLVSEQGGQQPQVHNQPHAPISDMY